jgi:LysM repeat protein
MLIDTADAPAGYHLVREGDNLYKLSMRYNVTIEELMYWNNLPDDRLKLMQMLKVKDDGSNPYKDSNPKIVDDVANGVRYRIHVVHQHERLFTIATRYNLSIVDLYKLNNLQSDALHVKQELIVGKEAL